ncbi:imidazolonepropionase-like amidohydrolase [Actinocorallia herbida]|uniref:Imidazolonepropionase-like amidohydrolase n=1 Tax=Actinocorallia herbida TaxID=58109 RepID=A0A3N1D280_9ACTN|nr:amidohydrolase family protein [Actinocorallia herbida]ROO87635.1 imidazolonepropionase-like amidohydrolase [Actinocorallia herbida]
MPEQRILFLDGKVFDGSGGPAVRADVVVRGEKIEAVVVGGGVRTEPGDQIVDCTGKTVMPGMIESHCHLTFPSAVGHLDPSFNPPMDVSFFHHLPSPDELLEIAKRNARILLDQGFTSAYSAGSLTPVPTEVILRDLIKAGATAGPRLRAASFERDNNPVKMGPDGPREQGTGPDAVRSFIREQAAIGFDSVKLLLSNDDVFFEGGSMVTQYSPEAAKAAGEQARESGVWLNCHAQNPESIKLAVTNGFRSIYHCSYADQEAIDLLDEAKDSIFLSPAVGIMWANVHEGEEFGIDAAMAETMGSVKSLEAMTRLYPELRRRGLRVLPGGDYGFPNNPMGRNARDLELFVELFGYSPLEALKAATFYGGQVLELPVGLLAPEYLADVLVVDGDPTQDVTVLQNAANLAVIMQGGRFHKRAEQLTRSAA